MGENEKGVIVLDISAHKVFLDNLSAGYGKGKVGADTVKNIYPESVEPAVLTKEAEMLSCGVSHAAVSGVAFNAVSLYLFNDILPHLGAEKILISMLSRVEFYRNSAGQRIFEGFIQLYDLPGGYIF